MTDLLQIGLLLFGLVSPFLLMVWLVTARRKALAKVEYVDHAEPELRRFATDDVAEREDGLLIVRHQEADHELTPPDSTGGELPGIRAIQGKR